MGGRYWGFVLAFFLQRSLHACVYSPTVAFAMGPVPAGLGSGSIPVLLAWACDSTHITKPIRLFFFLGGVFLLLSQHVVVSAARQNLGSVQIVLQGHVSEKTVFVVFLSTQYKEHRSTQQSTTPLLLQRHGPGGPAGSGDDKQSVFLKFEDQVFTSTPNPRVP